MIERSEIISLATHGTDRLVERSEATNVQQAPWIWRRQATGDAPLRGCAAGAPGGV